MKLPWVSLDLGGLGVAQFSSIWSVFDRFTVQA